MGEIHHMTLFLHFPNSQNVAFLMAMGNSIYQLFHISLFECVHCYPIEEEVYKLYLIVYNEKGSPATDKFFNSL